MPYTTQPSGGNNEARLGKQPAFRLRALLKLALDVIALPAAMTAERDRRQAAAFCFERAHRLSPREAEFVRAMTGWRGDPTDKQFAWLFAIYDRVRGTSP